LREDLEVFTRMPRPADVLTPAVPSLESQGSGV
jgi:hypothetical protein